MQNGVDALFPLRKIVWSKSNKCTMPACVMGEPVSWLETWISALSKEGVISIHCLPPLSAVEYIYDMQAKGKHELVLIEKAH